MKLVIKLALVLLTATVLTLILTYLLHRPFNRIMAQWPQPSAIKYDAFDPYYFSVVESDLDWRYLPLTWQRHYYLYVGHDSGAPEYGHFIEFSFHPGGDDVAAHLRKSSVEWSAEGVTFNEASGHRLFIPKQMFIGGR